MSKRSRNSGDRGDKDCLDNSGSKIRKIPEVNDDASSSSHSSAVRSPAQESYDSDSSTCSSHWSVVSSITSEAGTTNDDVIDGDLIAQLRELPPGKTGLERCPKGHIGYVNECIEKISDDHLMDVKPGTMSIVKIYEAKGRMPALEAHVDIQRTPYAKVIDGHQKRFAILAAQVGRPMYASAHVEIGPKFGRQRIQGALKKSLQKTIEIDRPGRSFRLTAIPKAGRDAKSSNSTPTNSPKPVPRTAMRRSAEGDDVKNKRAKFS